MSVKTGFLYSFWNKENELLYIGKTEQSLLSRLNGHNHLPSEAYEEIETIKFIYCPNPIKLDALEKLSISVLNPYYNSRDIYETENFENIYNINLIDELKWVILPEEIFYFNKKEIGLTAEEKKERVRRGVAIAKAQGKYKGKPKIPIDENYFLSECKKWRNGD